MRRFAAFDIDGTLVRWQLYHALADGLVNLGFVDASAYDRVKAARMEWKRRAPGASFRSYELELIKAYEVVLKNITTHQLEQAAESVFNEYKDQVYTYTRRLLAELKEQGYLIFAISGSQTEIIKLIAKHYGFDDYVATIYERAGDRFLGPKTIGSHNKAETLKALIKKHSVGMQGSFAVGDSKSDAEMMELVDCPIAFNPDKDLFEIASAKNWPIVIERKNMIYELENKDGKYQLVKTNAG